jgi:hypothetical protein
MTNPSPLSERQQQLLLLFSNCQLRMSPMEFWSRWDVTQEQIAQICHCDVSLVSRWFSPRPGTPQPMPYHLWYLALADRFLEFYEQLPPELKRQLCPMDD